MVQGEKILVTGANGFIGRNLCARLRAEGAQIRALLRCEASGPWDETVLADLSGTSLPQGCMDNVETVFHLAGKVHAVDEVRTDAARYQAVNVDGTAMLLAAAGTAQVRQFVFFSSVKAAGEGDDQPLDENTPAAPLTIYGKSKLQAEQLVLNAAAIDKVAVIRLAMVYGPGNPGNLGRMISAIRKGLFPPWPRICNRRSMVHVDDVVQAAMLASDNPRAAGQVFFVTDGQYYSTRQIYEWICASLGVSVRRWPVPLLLLKGLALAGDAAGVLSRRNMPYNSQVLGKLVGSSAYDSAKIRKMLGFAPKRTLEASLPEIIRTMD